MKFRIVVELKATTAKEAVKAMCAGVEPESLKIVTELSCPISLEEQLCQSLESVVDGAQGYVSEHGEQSANRYWHPGHLDLAQSLLDSIESSC